MDQQQSTISISCSACSVKRHWFADSYGPCKYEGALNSFPFVRERLNEMIGEALEGGSLQYRELMQPSIIQSDTALLLMWVELIYIP